MLFIQNLFYNREDMHKMAGKHCLLHHGGALMLAVAVRQRDGIVDVAPERSVEQVPFYVTSF